MIAEVKRPPVCAAVVVPVSPTGLKWSFMPRAFLGKSTSSAILTKVNRVRPRTAKS